VLGNLYMPIVLIARNDLEIPNLGKYPLSIADLKGKNWGSYGRGSDIENIMRVMARDAGLNPDSDSDVVWIGVGAPPTGLPALKAGQIDVYGTTMPASEVAIAGGYGKMVVDLREGEGPSDFKGSVYSVLLALSDRVKKEPELFEKFKAAHTKTYCWLKDPKNFDEAASIIQSNMPVADLSPEQYRDLVKRAIGLANIAYDPATLDKWSDMMTAGGILKERIPHDVVWDQVPRENPAC
jgi:NitT/TauT family transport system substrate-binding protein